MTPAVLYFPLHPGRTTCAGAFILRHLPQELCDMVIDYLSDNKTCLQRCALVCRSWTYRSQRHLFSSLHIRIIEVEPEYDIELDDTFYPDSAVQRLSECLIHSPHLAKHVRRLHITFDESESFENIQYQQQLAGILPAFYRLTDLTLTWLRDDITFNTVSITLLEEIQNIISSPLMKNIKLDGAWEFLGLASFIGLMGRRLPSLDSLELKCIFIIADIEASPSQDRKRDIVVIQSLTIRLCILRPLMNWLKTLSSSIHIKRLFLEHDGDSDEIMPFLETFSSRLEELHLSVEDFDPPLIDLSVLPKLRVLSIPLDESGISESLVTVSPTNCIESIELRTFMEYFDSHLSSFIETDQLLMTTNFTQLKMVKLSLEESSLTSQEFKRIKKSMRLLLGRGILYLRCSTGEILTSDQILQQASLHEVFYPADFAFFLEILEKENTTQPSPVDDNPIPAAPVSKSLRIFNWGEPGDVDVEPHFESTGDDFERHFGQLFTGAEDDASESPQSSNAAADSQPSVAESSALPPPPSFPPFPCQPSIPLIWFIPLSPLPQSQLNSETIYSPPLPPSNPANEHYYAEQGSVQWFSANNNVFVEGPQALRPTGYSYHYSNSANPSPLPFALPSPHPPYPAPSPEPIYDSLPPFPSDVASHYSGLGRGYVQLSGNEEVFNNSSQPQTSTSYPNPSVPLPPMTLASAMLVPPMSEINLYPLPQIHVQRPLASSMVSIPPTPTPDHLLGRISPPEPIPDQPPPFLMYPCNPWVYRPMQSTVWVASNLPHSSSSRVPSPPQTFGPMFNTHSTLSFSSPAQFIPMPLTIHACPLTPYPAPLPSSSASHAPMPPFLPDDNYKVYNSPPPSCQPEDIFPEGFIASIAAQLPDF